MVPVSVVIITKNEAELIASCINAAKLITDDIIIVDNDSSDETREIAEACGGRVYSERWDGYGANKNKGIALAKYDWILSIDADEIADEELIASVHGIKLDDAQVVYDIDFRSYYGQKPISYGSWGRDHHIRLFNRSQVKWAETQVHETLIIPQGIVVKRLKGYLHHYSVRDDNDFYVKTINYAKLSALKYIAGGRKAGFIKLHISPLFHFLKNYVVFLGLLDGREGWNIARMIAKQTRLKYHLLKNEPIHKYLEVSKRAGSMEPEVRNQKTEVIRMLDFGLKTFD